MSLVHAERAGLAAANYPIGGSKASGILPILCMQWTPPALLPISTLRRALELGAFHFEVC
jgi:hypothetical protein